jgi:signal transduction histidine kinase/putative methionine-R-sulfoxide reductase with GAF domain
VAVEESAQREEGPSLPWAAEGELRSMAQLEMLHRLARRLNQLNNVAQIGEVITFELRALIDYHNCRVHLIADDGETLLPIAFRGELSEYQGETFDALILKVGQGVTGRVAEIGESYYTPNANDDPQAVTIPGTPEVDESLLVVPLRYGDRVIGTVALAKLGIDQFDFRDMRVLEVLASHAAVAIENARLLERERQSAVAAHELVKFSQSLTRMRDVQTVLKHAIGPIPALIECCGVHVYVRNPVTHGFGYAFGQGQGAEEAESRPEVPAKLAEPMLLSLDEPFVLTREVVASFPPEYRTPGFDGEVLIAPLRWEPDGIGTMVILAPTETRRFTERDVELAHGIADITSLALGNASRFHELEQAADRLRALDEMKNMFLDAVSHELRTPLAAVLGIALTLQRGDVELSSEDHLDLVTRLVTNARKLERLLSDLLDLDRLTRGILRPNRHPTDVAALVRRVIENSDLLNNHEVTVDAPPVSVDLDGPKVERIVENLLANTARHTPAGTHVRVGITRRDGGILLVVEDDGPGIPADLRESIFQPFQQGPNRNPHSPGVGIGLSLVARFAELHGGRAWVDERAGGGASFHVFLPGEDPISPVS